ncbi:LCP family protein [Dermatophilaceae bacterium Sec6.4]|nr:LCP family protein [Actinomycetota bacterium]
MTQENGPSDPTSPDGQADVPATGDDRADSADSGQPGTRHDAAVAKKRPGCFKVGCLTLLSMFVIVALAVGGLALYVNHELGKVQHSQALLPDTGPAKDLAAGDAQNILLLASDSRGTNLRDNGRSDVIQLMHISKGQRTIQVIHFPRDMYVAIPGHGMNKINAAYSFGGSKLLVTTVQNLLNLHIDHVAQIGFDGFTKLTDAMGGVEIYVPIAFNEKGYGSWTKGYHHMNGAQALGFSQERHQLPRGDLDRGVDQQQWIDAMVVKALSRGTLQNPKRALDMISAIAPYLLVDMSTTDLLKLAVSMRNINKSDVTYYSAPIKGFTTNAVGDVDIVDLAKLRQIGTHLRTDSVLGAGLARNTVG